MLSDLALIVCALGTNIFFARNNSVSRFLFLLHRWYSYLLYYRAGGVYIGGIEKTKKGGEYKITIHERTNTDKTFAKAQQKIDFMSAVRDQYLYTNAKDGFVVEAPVFKAGHLPGPFTVNVSICVSNYLHIFVTSVWSFGKTINSWYKHSRIVQRWINLKYSCFYFLLTDNLHYGMF